MDLLSTALHWQAMGIATIPIQARSKQPALPRWKPYQTELPTRAALTTWFHPGLARNYAVVMGWQNLTVIDFDMAGAYEAWVTWAMAQGGIAEAIACHTYTVLTARGAHVYITTEDRGRKVFDAGDVKQTGYVLGAGSTHPSGATYTALDAGAPILPVDDLAAVFPGITDSLLHAHTPPCILGLGLSTPASLV